MSMSIVAWLSKIIQEGNGNLLDDVEIKEVAFEDGLLSNQSW